MAASAVLGSLLILAAACHARPLDLSEILGLHTPRDIALSPEGSLVAFTVGWVDTTNGRSMSEIRIAGTETPPRDGPLPPDPTVLVPASLGPWAPQFSPDGKTLAFLSVDGDGRQVWTVPAAGGTPKKVTRSSAVKSFLWMPDGSGVVTLSAVPGTAPSRDPVIEGAPRSPLRFTFTTLSGSPRTLHTGDAGIDDWDIDAKGERIVFSSNGTGVPDHENRFDLFVLTLTDGSVRRLTSRFGPETHPKFSPDGTEIAFQADQDTSVTYSQEEIFVVPAEGGNPMCVTAGRDDAMTDPRFEGGSLVTEVARKAGNTFEAVPLEPPGTGGRFLGLMDMLLGPGFITTLAQSRSASAWITERPGEWGRICWSRNRDPVCLPLPYTPPAKDRVPVLSETRWTSDDGRPIEGVLLAPPAGTPPYPTIVILHGGPYNRATARLSGSDTATILASRGYLVLMPNYRGSKGYGEAFAQALRGDPGRLELDDINTGLDSLIARGLADRDRLGILGWSYGGYLTNLAITKTDRFKAAVTMYGMSSLENDYYFGESPSYELEYLGGPPWEKPELYRDRSPLTHVDAIRTPLLLLHGEEDRKVSIDHAKAMWTALTQLGRTVELVRYPGEGHGFRQYAHKVDAARRTAEWFDRYLRK